MKQKVLAVLLCIALLFSISAVGVSAAPTPSYQLDEVMSPFWDGDTVYNESVLFADLGDGASANLLYPATEIVSVKNAQLNVTYQEGKDYVYENGKLTLPAGSSIPYMTKAELYPSSGTFRHKDGSSYLAWSEGTFFHERQTVVTYKHDSVYNGPMPYYDKDKLPNTMARLKNASALSVLLYGDSISEGYNASGYTGIAPYMPSYGQLAVDWWEQVYGADITYTNTALSGMDTNWGVNNVESRVNAYNPDLVIIAFGMNDGTSKMSPATYRGNIQRIMNAVKAKNAKAEFILVAPMMPNPESTFTGTQAAFKAELDKLAAGNDAIVVDMTSVHLNLLETKAYRDMTGNNINHPNDYLVRWYAQMVAYSLIDQGYKQLTINSNYDEHATVTVNGKQYNLPYSGAFKPGDTVSISVNPKDEEEFKFIKWTSGITGSENTAQLTIDDNTSLTAEFINIAPVNIALNKAVTTNSEIGGWPASRLTDGVRNHLSGNNGYSSDGFSSPNISAPIQVTIDLGSAQLFNRVTLYPRSDTASGVAGASSANFPTDFQIQVSNDGVNFTSVYTASNQANPDGTPLKVSFDAAQARYVRLNVTKLGLTASDEAAAYRLQLQEIEVCNVVADPEKDLDVPETVNVNERFTVTVVTDPDIVQIYLLNESGMKLGGVRSISYTSDGRKVWTLSTSIGTAGQGRHITIAGARQNETFFKINAFDIDVMIPVPTLMRASFLNTTGAVNRPVTLSVVTDQNAAKVEIYNEYGLKLTTARTGYVDMDDMRIWSVPLKIGTPGQRTFTVRTANRINVYAESDLTTSITIGYFK
ncbi:MAG: hypothetical protein HFE85_01190 [Clostridiales bacterium]|nr:hypothetical protein [Clostridiales bacterium]